MRITNLMMISETERQDASDELQTSLGDLAALQTQNFLRAAAAAAAARKPQHTRTESAAVAPALSLNLNELQHRQIYHCPPLVSTSKVCNPINGV